MGTNVRVRVYNAGLLVRSRSASKMSCNQSVRSVLSAVFFCHGANAELIPKFHVALLVSHVTSVNINIYPLM
jgi:hypothetical protein